MIGSQMYRPHTNPKPFVAITKPLLCCGCAMLVVSMLLLRPARAAPAHMTGLPENPELAGDAFVAAWLAFRRDLDSLSHSRIHPALLTAWFDAAPTYLVQDAARLATNPTVFFAAVARLAERGGDHNRLFITELKATQKNEKIALRLQSYQIRSGDLEARKGVRRNLNSAWFYERMRAALVLAEAGDEKGLAFLKKLVQKNQKGAAIAARTLGRYGGKGTEAFLTRTWRRRPEDPVLPAALGELAMRRLFPHHHRMLVARDPGQGSFDKGGLYQVWLAAIGEAIRSGALDSEGVLYLVEEMEKFPPPVPDTEAHRRQMVALAGFWRLVDRQIAATTSLPPWPADFHRAMEIVSQRSSLKKFSPRGFVERVSAAISLCIFNGRTLAYEQLVARTPDIRVLTPGASRAMDGNLATAWHGVAGNELILDLETKKIPRSLWIMNSCPLGQGSRLRAVRVRGSGRNGDWDLTSPLTQNTAYFQEVLLPGAPARRMVVELSQTTDQEPTCIAEIRVGF